MTAHEVVLLAGAAANLWLAALVALRVRRTVARATYLLMVLDFVAMAALVLGLQSGAPEESWAAAALWTFVLSHPLAALFVLSALHGEDLLRRRPYLLLLLAPAPVLAALAPPEGYDLSEAYVTAPLNWYLVLCLALPLGEAFAAWWRTRARRGELFVLLAGAIALVLTGPVYGFELQALGIANLAGSNPGTPVASALFALALVLANPLPARKVPPADVWDPNLPGGRVVLVDEDRPKASAHYASRSVAAGRPVLKLVRGPAGSAATGQGSLAITAMGPTRWPASVVLATASEFLARHPAGAVHLRDLAYLVVHAGLPAAREVLATLQRRLWTTHGTVVASMALLTPAERAELRTIPRIHALRLPDPATETAAILAAELGAGGAHLLRAFAASEHRRIEDLGYEDLPAFLQFLETAMRELARTPGDEPVIKGWRKAFDRISLELDRFARQTLPEASQGPWPSERAAPPGEELVVRAADYWKGRDLEAALRAAAARAERVRTADRVRAAFVQVLGRTGEHIFEAELRRLGKPAADLDPADVRRIAEAAEVAVASLGTAVDVAAGRADLEERGRRLRSLLAGITEEASRAA